MRGEKTEGKRGEKPAERRLRPEVKGEGKEEISLPSGRSLASAERAKAAKSLAGQRHQEGLRGHGNWHRMCDVFLHYYVLHSDVCVHVCV